MLRKAVLLVVFVLAIASPTRAALAGAPARAAGTASHSGILTAIDPARGTLTLQEMGSWKGPATKPISWSIALTPRTTIELVRRSHVASDGGWPRGYVESPLKAVDLHRGEFATVSTVQHGRQLVAVSIQVVRPSAD
jgi:hypothetical protein